jgi:CBS-domain-containing membrane protein
MTGLIIATSILSVLLLNTWCAIFLLAKETGAWLCRQDLKFLLICAVINSFIILGCIKLWEAICKKFYQRKRRKRY